MVISSSVSSKFSSIAVAKQTVQNLQVQCKCNSSTCGIDSRFGVVLQHQSSMECGRGRPLYEEVIEPHFGSSSIPLVSHAYFISRKNPISGIGLKR